METFKISKCSPFLLLMSYSETKQEGVVGTVSCENPLCADLSCDPARLSLLSNTRPKDSFI